MQRTLILFFIGISSSVQLLGQFDQVKTIHIKATRPKPPLQANGDTYTQDMLERRQQGTPIETLRHLPGITVLQSGGAGSLARVSVRGAPARYTLTAIDGVVLRDPSTPQEVFDAGNLMLPWDTQIHLQKGSQSLLYGPSAMAGVINLQTVRPDTDVFKAEGGQTNLADATLQTVYHKKKEKSIHVGIRGHTSGQGQILNPRRDNRFPDKKRHFSSAIKLKYQKISTLLFYEEGTLRIADRSQFLPLMSDAHQKTCRFLGAISYGKLTKGPFVQASFQQTNAEREDTSLPTSKTVGQVAHIQGQHIFSLSDKTDLTTGVDASLKRTKIRRMWDDVGILGIYGKVSHRLSPLWRCEAGGRFDLNEHGKNAITTQLGLSRMQGKQQIYTLVGTSFRPPSMGERKGSLYARANPQLSPERAINEELGHIWQRDGTTTKTAIFAQQIQKIINFVEQRPVGHYENKEKLLLYGIEQHLHYQLNPAWSLGETYALVWGCDSKNQGKQPAATPLHHISLSLDYATEKTSFFLSGNFESARRDETVTPAIRLRPIMSWRLGGAYQISQKQKIYCRIENALNQTQETSYGYNTRKRTFILGYRQAFSW